MVLEDDFPDFLGEAAVKSSGNTCRFYHKKSTNRAAGLKKTKNRRYQNHPRNSPALCFFFFFRLHDENPIEWCSAMLEKTLAACRQLCVLYWLGNGISVGLFRVPLVSWCDFFGPKTRPWNPPKRRSECLEGEIWDTPNFSGKIAGFGEILFHLARFFLGCCGGWYPSTLRVVNLILVAITGCIAGDVPDYLSDVG